jgi:hypothetical protein
MDTPIIGQPTNRRLHRSAPSEAQHPDGVSGLAAKVSMFQQARRGWIGRSISGDS